MALKTEFAQVAQKGLAWFGFGGAGGVFAMTAAEVELAIRIVVGILSAISITIHLCWSWSDRRKKNKT